MKQVDFLAASLPVMELTPTGRWVYLGQARGVKLSRYRRGRGFGWTGTWRTLALEQPDQQVRVLRWQPDKVVVERVEEGT
jgi:hypothetical protein